MVKALITICDIKPTKNKEQLENLLDSPCFPGEFSEVVCLYDNCTEGFIEYFEQKYPFTTSLPNTGNRLNFSRNANRGLRRARADKEGALLINMDCVLPKFDLLKDLFVESGISTPKPYAELDLPEGSGEVEQVSNRFAFFCPFISADVLEKVGVLNGVYRAGFDDDEYIARALLAGFPCFVVDRFVYHEGSLVKPEPGWESATGSYGQINLDRALDKYYNEFRIPRSVQHGDAIPWILEHHEWNDGMKVE